ncbi:MAG TPA: ABC transporter substrate-binding protein [Pseudonocardia sp.]|jgi:peptide/nickel transport system substrate-binding protein|nr:ABC transporter substrate-binding protein [Pseudonocardia sp.]
MRWGLRRRTRSVAAVFALIGALILAGCAQQQTTPSTGHRVAGGVATMALKANGTANYIFPFLSARYLSNINVSMLQYLLYRPLYWFGDNERPVVNAGLSLAEPPKFADDNRTVTVTLKDYNWSDGTKVSADNVVFWMNMMKAEKVNWASYIPGGIPDDVDSVTADSPTQVTFRLNRTYSQVWFLYNELAQITPLPKAWDRTASGPADCTHRISDCAGVYDYLADAAKSQNTYDSNPLWQVVDGPWRLKYFNADGHVSFVPNPSYSGPVKPTLDQFNLAPFATNAAEYNVLRSGNNSIQVGYLPPENAPLRAENQRVGHNPLGNNYTLDRWQTLSVNYFVFNANHPTLGPIFRQLYIRQALQLLVDQKSLVKAAAHGYGSITTGPVPTDPPNPYATERTQPELYPYSPERARALLAGHGWSTPPDGVATCLRPGSGPDQCGPGIPGGARLEFEFLYGSGTQTMSLQTQQLQSSASKVGIKVDLRGAPFNTVFSTLILCRSGAPDCNWEAGAWGLGWTFAPAFYPSGEQIFATGAASNHSNFSDPELDRLIADTQVSDAPDAMLAYSRYGSRVLPSIWFPAYDYLLTEIANNLKGVTPQNPFLNINPENWYYVK